mgnify:CR=1 FL=1
MQIIRSIQNRIYEIRGERKSRVVEVACVEEVETKVLNQAVKRNIKRFPEDFMFQLSAKEWSSMRSQIVTTYPQLTESEDTNWSQIVTSSRKHRGATYRPYAFTEQGVAMLSGVLNSDKAINMNIAIMRAFVEIRRILIKENDLKEQMKEIKERLGEHDAQLNQIYEAMENLLDEKASHRKWEERERIGYK